VAGGGPGGEGAGVDGNTAGSKAKGPHQRHKKGSDCSIRMIAKPRPPLETERWTRSHNREGIGSVESAR
jgi:hypothetical protein